MSQECYLGGAVVSYRVFFKCPKFVIYKKLRDADDMPRG